MNGFHCRSHVHSTTTGRSARPPRPVRPRGPWPHHRRPAPSRPYAVQERQEPTDDGSPQGGDTRIPWQDRTVEALEQGPIATRQWSRSSSRTVEGRRSSYTIGTYRLGIEDFTSWAAMTVGASRSCGAARSRRTSDLCHWPQVRATPPAFLLRSPPRSSQSVGWWDAVVCGRGRKRQVALTVLIVAAGAAFGGYLVRRGPSWRLAIAVLTSVAVLLPMGASSAASVSPHHHKNATTRPRSLMPERARGSFRPRAAGQRSLARSASRRPATSLRSTGTTVSCRHDVARRGASARSSGWRRTGATSPKHKPSNWWRLVRARPKGTSSSG